MCGAMTCSDCFKMNKETVLRAAAKENAPRRFSFQQHCKQTPRTPSSTPK